MNRKGFTLLELMVVVIVIGILASIAIPQFLRAAEKGRMAEGLGLLGVLRGAEVRYYAEHADWTATEGDLDVDYTTPQFFTVTSVGTSDENVALVTRNATDVPAAYVGYTMQISDNGTITKTAGTGGSVP